ncbi:hypothetical protein F5Y03DRAFT_343886 [Xylaria venustula]|nr:hypothetical protein F5Y03DRAFT_343886 [Xylaria venustula]
MSIQKRKSRNGGLSSENENNVLCAKRLCLPAGAGTSHVPRSSCHRDVGYHATLAQESGLDDICFGMLKDIRAWLNYSQDTYLSISDKLGKDSDDFATLELALTEDRCDFLAYGVPVATMGSKTHFALKSLSSAAMLKYRGIVLRSEFHQKLGAAARSTHNHASKIFCNIALLVFGPRSTKDILAKDLSKYRLFLQHPVPMPEGVVYDNPQYLRIAGSSFGNGVILPPIAADIFYATGSSTPDPEEPATFASVLDNLPRNDSIRSVGIDPRIRTTLLSHQKEALDFLVYRETVQKEKNILWKPAGSSSVKPMYRHIITGSTSPEPNDILGGILGDGMGLGKTLSMIACIVSSLRYAEMFQCFSKENGLQKAMSPAPVSSTLVIVPDVLLLDTWIDEIERHVVTGTLSVYKYHGPNRKLPSSSPLPYDVVLSTYGTVAADYSRGGGVLTSFHWHRLILDEAHVIRNWSTKQFKATRNISASIRWCMTGTPIQNDLKDLSSLITFLRVPFLDNATIFRKRIGDGREAIGSKINYRNLRHLLESVCLRRCTLAVLSSLGVSFTEHRPQLSDNERKCYNELSVLCGQYIKAAVSGTSAKRGNNSILMILLRLRMFCNTCSLGPREIPFADTQGEDELWPDEFISLLQQCGRDICTNCKAEVLSTDTDTLFEQSRDPTNRPLKCQGCAQRTPDAQDTTKSQAGFETPQSHSDADSMQGVQFGHDNSIPYPSKVLCLIEDITRHLDQDKCIVFSFWRRSLDLVEKILIEHTIPFGRVDGTIHPSKRKQVLAEFQQNTSTRVLLMTIGTGAVGLNNLTTASRVHILEPQWNPSIEDQAIGRVARLGQSKKVTVVRYIVQKSIEEQSIESRQLQKLQLSLKSGLKTSDQDLSKKQIQQLGTLRQIIESNISTPIVAQCPNPIHDIGQPQSNTTS